MATLEPSGERLRSLQAVVEEDGPLPYADAADYIRQAAEGLAHVHAARLSHRNLTPARLLIDSRNVVKLIDWDLACYAGKTPASLTAAYECAVGVVDYMAPEQALNSHAADDRADIYSLGCVLYFLLTAHAPFPNGTLPQRLMMHQNETPLPIERDRPDVPKALVDICTMMMAKDPKRRYQSATDVAAALAQWLEAHGHGLE